MNDISGWSNKISKQLEDIEVIYKDAKSMDAKSMAAYCTKLFSYGLPLCILEQCSSILVLNRIERITILHTFRYSLQYS